jgi:hypothetical protein
MALGRSCGRLMGVPRHGGQTPSATAAVFDVRVRRRMLGQAAAWKKARGFRLDVLDLRIPPGPPAQ